NPSFDDAQYAIFGGKFLTAKNEKQKPKQQPSKKTTEELHNHDKSRLTVNSYNCGGYCSNILRSISDKNRIQFLRRSLTLNNSQQV
ncbi:hypothetical protein, partial [Nostoc sp.]